MAFNIEDQHVLLIEKLADLRGLPQAKDAALISEATFDQRTALALKKRLFNVPKCELAKTILDKKI